MPDEAAKPVFPDHDERRRSGRGRTLFGGTIVFRDGSATVHCVVRNRTGHGVQIEVPESQLIPRRFFLVNSKDDQVYEAELVWRKADRIGVVLGRTIDPETSREKALRFLRKPVAAAASETEMHSWEDKSRWPV